MSFLPDRHASILDSTAVVSDTSANQVAWASIASDAWRPQPGPQTNDKKSPPAKIANEGRAISDDVLYIHQLELDLVHTGGLASQDLTPNERYLGRDSQALLDGRPSILIHDVSQSGAFAQESFLTGRPSPIASQIGVDTHLNNFGVTRDANGVEHFLFTDVDKTSPDLRNEIDLEKTAVSVLEHAQRSGRSTQDQQKLVGDLTSSYLAEIRRLAATGQQPPAALTAQEATGAIQQAMEETQRSNVSHQETRDRTPASSSSETSNVSDQTRAAIANSLSEYVQQPGMSSKVAYPIQIVHAVQEKSSSGSSFGMTNYRISLASKEPGGAPVEVELKEVVPAPGSSDPGNMHSADAANVVANAQYFDGSTSPVLGHAQVNGHSYLVRPNEANTPKVSFDKLSFADQESYVQNVGVVLARMHARNADDLRNITTWAAGKDAVIQQNLERFAADYENHLQALSATLRDSR